MIMNIVWKRIMNVTNMYFLMTILLYMWKMTKYKVSHVKRPVIGKGSI